MKTFSITFLILGSVILQSCNGGGDKDKISGKWKIASMEIQYYKQQKENSARQLKMLQDSIAANSDSAKVARFQMQLSNIEEREKTFKDQQDSAMAQNRWEFKDNGDFEAIESDGVKKGMWSYDDEKGILFTIIDKQTSSVHVRWNGDTMILQLDSVNHMGFVPAKD